jgi:hypothetical protein
MTNQGNPMDTAPRDGTVILVEACYRGGVPETGHYDFKRVVPNAKFGSDSWCSVDQPNMHYGPKAFLRWWPDGTDTALIAPTRRTNFNYRPGNGSEGEWFDSKWCSRCKRDAEYRERDENGCGILAKALMYDIGDPGYPTEWTFNRDNDPICAAFEPIGA